ncbi:LysR substrate-binding domain-containing protein [Celerinatantimonas yamalensis]|uniref:LysR substrate-binding domain-containing protein n=1 Tax=Celerinatantimonas yamalensis TaxID=559956 RepID=A0ABW9G407_9GAMM
MQDFPSFKALEAFSTIARLGSIGAAARELKLTQAAISQQLKTLEQQLGHLLFERNPRGVILTDIGQRYLPVVQGSLQHLKMQTQLLFSQQTQETLVVKVNHTFSHNWLMPRINDFLTRYPFIHIELQQVDWPSRVPCKDVDIEITNGFEPSPSVQVEQLFQERWLLVCSPTYQQQYADALALGAISELSAVQVKGYVQHWSHWLSYHQWPLTLPEIRLEVSNSLQALQAAKYGVGIALIRSLAAQDALQMGTLVQARPEVMPTTDSHYLITSRSRTPKVSFFCEWLAQQVLHR